MAGDGNNGQGVPFGTTVAAIQTPLDDHLSDTVDAHDATAVSFSATGSIAATTVQAAIEEVATDYIAADAAHVAAGDPHTGYVLESAHTLSAHDTLGLATQTELDTHAAAADPHTGYRLESVALTDADIAAANKDGTTATPSLRTLGTGAAQAAAGDHAHAGAYVTRAGGVAPTVAELPFLNAKDYAKTTAQAAAYGDGNSKPLSGYYASLAAAQADYPHAAALTDQLDWAIVQAALNTLAATTDLTTGANPTILLGRRHLKVNRTFAPPNSASHFVLKGAGKNSTLVEWIGGNSEMLLLTNPRNVRVADLSLVGNSGGSNRPTYGIRAHRAAGQTGSPSTTGVTVERVTIGGTSADAMTVGIGFTNDAGQDTNNDLGAFRDVDILNVGTGYKFETTNTLWHLIEGGNINGCSVAAIDNVAGANASVAGTGGSFTVFGTRFGNNTLIYRLGGVEGANTIDIFGMNAESDTSLLSTPSTVSGYLRVRFFGGQANVDDPGVGDTVKFDASDTSSALEFHGFSLSSPSGVRYNFPNAATVAVFGGRSVTAEWRYNGPLIIEHMHESAGAPVFTDLGSGQLRDGSAVHRVVTPPASVIESGTNGNAWFATNYALGNRFSLDKPMTARYVNFGIGTQSGNIQVCVVKFGSGSWDFTRVMDSGVIACPAAGHQRLDLGATVLDAGEYAVMFWADNTTVATSHGASDVMRSSRLAVSHSAGASGVAASGTLTDGPTSRFLRGFTLEAAW